MIMHFMIEAWGYWFKISQPLNFKVKTSLHEFMHYNLQQVDIINGLNMWTILLQNKFDNMFIFDKARQCIMDLILFDIGSL